MATLSKAEQRIKTALAEFINLKHPVALAVEPLREKAIERSETEAKKAVKEIREDLAKHGNDLNKAAPFPDSTMNRYAYVTAHAKYYRYSALCKHRQGSRGMNDPDFVDIDPNLVNRFIHKCKEGAADDYDAFIVKLCQKIGACSSAEISGEHVWGRSYLKVDGKDVWMTRQIINVSKLGRLFNQWPSRKMK